MDDYKEAVVVLTWYHDNICLKSESIKVPSSALILLHLLDKVQPAVVNIILGEGRHWLWSLSQSQIAVVGLTDD